jgi:predicted RNA methylase
MQQSVINFEVMIKKILKKLLPDFILSLLIKYNENKKRNILRRNIIDYLENMPSKDMTDEKSEVLNYLKHNLISVFPYYYTKKYQPEDVTVYADTDREMRYVLQDGKRLYFKKDWDEKKIQDYYNGLLIEQDEESPHRYETPEFYVSEGDVVVDAGVAEGNFSLSIIEKAKKVYLFEADETWVDALEATFAPWQEKVFLVNKYVSDETEDGFVRLDDFFGNQKIDLLKVDIEGTETQLLEGSKKILMAHNLSKIVICTYHKKDDADNIEKVLTRAGFQIKYSKGYMIYPEGNAYVYPYLRRGLIRGSRNN